jgi:NADPH:quinone reductase-like Zn-dependent oxidoreductase
MFPIPIKGDFSMKAVVATRFGAPDVLQLQEVDKPTPRDNEILIKVRATTVNVGDIRMRSFDVPPLFRLPAHLTLGFRQPKHPIYGMELAGEVEAVGKQVTHFKPGDRVFASTLDHHFGAHAEYKCLPEDAAIAAMPGNMTYEEAAVLALSANTALFFLEAANIRPGQKVLINGAAGSVGTFAIQIAKHYGAEVTAVGGGRNIELMKSLGADRVIDYTQVDFTQTGETYDVIFDAAGKTKYAQGKRALKPNGYYLHTVIVAAGLQGLLQTMKKDKHVIGGTAAPSQKALAALKELVEAGRLKSVIDRCYPLADTAEAHRYVETGHKTGNVVITVDEQHA